MIPALWAPEATRVELAVPPAEDHAGVRHPMRPDPTNPSGPGWWIADVDLPAGTDYAFAVDGGEPRPDPRSSWQPAGPHGPSRVFDATGYDWSDDAWPGRDARGAVTYELHVGTFTPQGTLDAAAGKLEHLAALGVEMVELMPLAEFTGERGWGYDGVNLYAVHHAYGGPAALQRFVDAAHGHGLGVCLDVVYNHLGPSGNYLSEAGPYFTDEHHTPWGAAVNLDQDGSEGVRRWICDNALRWFADFHVDALRLDAVHALVDDSPTHILAQLSAETADLALELGRPLSLVAESDLNDVAMITPVADSGCGMTAQWADDVHHALHAWLTGEEHGYYVDFGSGEVLAKALTRAFVHDGSHSTFRGRSWGRPVPPETDGRQLVVFASNHDQVGNRALGDRPAARLSVDELGVSAALVLLSPFTPMIFMGEEWGARTPFQFFTDHPDPELGQAVSEGRMSEFGSHGWDALYGGRVEVPDPQLESTFAASRLDWTEPETGEHARLLAWNQQLIRLRAEVPALTDGNLAATTVEASADAVVMHRGDVTVLAWRPASEGTETRTHPTDGRPVLATWGVVDASPQSASVTADGAGVVVLGPRA
ncbi:malto-oligosyltrehalose trehalohydrolase [Flavimobilis marinus]|uniref:Malto-oligosyltrehalose trehalohydrolase n=1 Tax=Flavimobilis marinus TaxID=285351 RepID=A0A1I2FP76_9MICO|nr:malto-oligosyltrehalose trehalohydrolase [Flavimobilis marinus]GHG51715.1 malto-oligosyltrehalose trehalohydrolase [Flavimobilis marinus]SFF06221.1 maltooligosyl trehalose hydrolase [Flavimobilis marinus]